MSVMTISIFDATEDAYWWVLCTEKHFKAINTSEEVKVADAVAALRGRALYWWVWWSHRHPTPRWDTFTTALLWRFKPEWRHILPIDDEKEEPDSASLNIALPERMAAAVEDPPEVVDVAVAELHFGENDTTIDHSFSLSQPQLQLVSGTTQKTVSVMFSSSPSSTLPISHLPPLGLCKGRSFTNDDTSTVIDTNPFLSRPTKPPDPDFQKVPTPPFDINPPPSGATALTEDTPKQIGSFMMEMMRASKNATCHPLVPFVFTQENSPPLDLHSPPLDLQCSTMNQFVPFTKYTICVLPCDWLVKTHTGPHAISLGFDSLQLALVHTFSSMRVLVTILQATYTHVHYQSNPPLIKAPAVFLLAFSIYDPSLKLAGQWPYYTFKAHLQRILLQVPGAANVLPINEPGEPYAFPITIKLTASKWISVSVCLAQQFLTLPCAYNFLYTYQLNQLTTTQLTLRLGGLNNVFYWEAQLLDLIGREYTEFNFKRRWKKGIVGIGVIAAKCLFGSNYGRIEKFCYSSKPFVDLHPQPFVLLYGYMFRHCPTLLLEYENIFIQAIVIFPLLATTQFFFNRNTSPSHWDDAIEICRVLLVSKKSLEVGSIQTMIIGVGIWEIKEMQTLMIHDFATTHFQFSEQLLVTQGHWFNTTKRIGQLISNVYKSLEIDLPISYFETLSGQSTAQHDYLYLLSNSEPEKSAPHQVLFNSHTVGIHRHHTAYMNHQHLLGFIQSTFIKIHDEVVFFIRVKYMTLKEVFESLDLIGNALNIDLLTVLADKLWALRSVAIPCSVVILIMLAKNVKAAFIQKTHKHYMLPFSMRIGTGKKWDPGGHLELSCAAGWSSFKQWDPGKFIQRCNFYNLEDKVDLDGDGNVMILEAKRIMTQLVLEARMTHLILE